MQATNWAADILQLVKYVGVTWPPNVTQHEKTVLMCRQNLTTFLDFNLKFIYSNFLSINIVCVSLKHLLIVELTVGNPLQFTELV